MRLMRRLRLIPAALCACAATTCTDPLDALPTGPSDPTAGIVIYSRPNFSGVSAHVAADIADLAKYSGPCEHEGDEDSPSTYDWSDCISSIRVAPGLRAVIYVDANFKGWGMTVDRDVADLGFVLGPCRNNSLDRCVTSIRLPAR